MTRGEEIPAEVRKTALLLGAGGAIPFVAAALAAWLFTDSMLANWLERAAYLYAAVILSFLGGIHWGLALRAARPTREAFIISVAPALVAWTAVLIPHHFGLTLLAVAFVAQFILDLRLRLPAWFRNLRAGLTLVVVASLVLLLAAD